MADDVPSAKHLFYLLQTASMRGVDLVATRLNASESSLWSIAAFSFCCIYSGLSLGKRATRAQSAFHGFRLHFMDFALLVLFPPTTFLDRVWLSDDDRDRRRRIARTCSETGPQCWPRPRDGERARHAQSPCRQRLRWGGHGQRL